MKVARFYRLGALACVVVALAAFFFPSVEQQVMDAFDELQMSRARSLIDRGCVVRRQSSARGDAAGPLAGFVLVNLHCQDGIESVVVRSSSEGQLVAKR